MEKQLFDYIRLQSANIIPDECINDNVNSIMSFMRYIQVQHNTECSAGLCYYKHGTFDFNSCKCNSTSSCFVQPKKNNQKIEEIQEKIIKNHKQYLLKIMNKLN